ncbi:MAG: hypothetical protein K6A43_10430, partial [Treponema sp.]|nr:hypothetical protein [Treponema sp.]
MKIKIHTKIQKALIHNSWTSYLAQKKISQLTRTIIFASILIFLSSNLFAQKSNATTSSNSITNSNTATNNTSALNSSSPHPDAFSQIAVKSFADELFLQGFFDEAETEYRRYLFITNAAGTKNTDSSKNMTENSTNADSESAISALSSIYNTTNNISGAKWLFNNFFFDSTVNSTPNLQEQNLQENLLKLYSRLVFAERNYDDFSSLFETANPFINNFSTEVQFILPFSQKLLAHDISGALQICKTTKTPLTNSIMSENLSSLLKSCSSYKTKSPGLALFLSSIFP